jgi:hypothetical protein
MTCGAPSSSMTHRALAQEGPDLHRGDILISPAGH